MHVYCPVTVPFVFSTSRLNMRLSRCSDHTVNTSHPPTGHPTAIWRKGTFPARVIKNLQIIVHSLALAPSHAVCPLRRPTHAHGVVVGPRTRPSRGGCWAAIYVEKTARVTNSTTAKGEADMLRHHSHGVFCCLQMTADGLRETVTPMTYLSRVA